MPVIVRKDKNEPSGMPLIFKHESPQREVKDKTISDDQKKESSRLKKTMGLIATKLQDRFSSTTQAFRYFDENQNTTISY